MKRALVVAALALILAPSALAADVYVRNESSLPDAEVAAALPAFQQAADTDFGPAWDVSGKLRWAGDEPVPAGAWSVRIVDVPDCILCAGYHGVDHGVPYAVVGTLDDWQITFTHELWEILVNPYVDRGVLVGKRWWALETADPVEAEKFAYLRGEVRISDFVLPNWFRKGSTGPWDFTKHVERPRQVLEDGYQLVHRGTAWTSIWGPGGNGEGLAKARRWNAIRGAGMRSPVAGPA
jgi:hypothetical protein